MKKHSVVSSNKSDGTWTKVGKARLTERGANREAAKLSKTQPTKDHTVVSHDKKTTR